MRVLYAPASPFARKVRITAAVKGFSGKLELVPTDTVHPADDTLMRTNPLGKIPALVLDDGRSVYDSKVICEYLDAIGTGPALFPKDWNERLGTLTLGALADGITEAAVLLVYEKRFRPEDKWVPQWIDRQQAKIDRALASLSAAPPHWKTAPDYGHLTLACALGYLDFRHGGAWRSKFPELVGWLDKYAAAVPAFAETTPG